MKVGDYVRTKKHGIGKIISFSYQEDDECCFIELSKRRTGIKQSNIIKSSPNIIDLIEVGDIVNYGLLGGGMVIFKKDGGITTNTILFSNLKEKDIKKIITKEQIENIEYEVK